ncbi:MAG: hypothetical protein L0Y72_25030 [Gemmataceae bacterium]|nr:hypothetical protein [Gemmataceae bacterium]MCI0742309.1 hypothetical protein [Gemmataceae bacterium]
MKIRKSLVGLCAILPFALTSCVEVNTVNPLSDPHEAKVDEDLIGRWE